MYIATDEGWLYLAGLKDLYSGEIVGYAMSERMTKHLVMQALLSLSEPLCVRHKLMAKEPLYATQTQGRSDD